MIISLSGFIGSGKDTIADYLVNIHQFRRESFASSLKDAVSTVFGWDRELLEGRTRQSREWRETTDTWWAARLNIPHLTPRFALQHWGTEVVRRGFHDDMWIASLENKLRSTTDHIVISDCRFPNEIHSVRANHGRVIWVQRGAMPEWYHTAVQANLGDASSQAQLKHQGIHASESAWAGTQFDAVIKNDSSLDQLYSSINDLVQDPRFSKSNPAA